MGPVLSVLSSSEIPAWVTFLTPAWRLFRTTVANRIQSCAEFEDTGEKVAHESEHCEAPGR